MRKRTVYVRDKMQKHYRYAISAPKGRDFDQEFKPELTPAHMLQLGVFCGLINIIPQFVVILATIVSFARLDQLAAICLFPLAAWVAFAAILNTAIWLLNS